MTSKRAALVGFVLVFGLGVYWSTRAATASQAREVVPLPSPVILSGADVGFRIEAQQGNTPVGKIVVRIKGQWVEAAIGGIKPPLIAVPLTEQRDISPRLPGGRRP